MDQWLDGGLTGDRSGKDSTVPKTCGTIIDSTASSKKTQVLTVEARLACAGRGAI